MLQKAAFAATAVGTRTTNAKGFFLCTWLGNHATTMSQDVKDIAKNEPILRVAIEVASFFTGMFSKENDLWLFWRAPSASQKALSKSQKGPFSRKRTVLDATSNTQKICEEPYLEFR